MGRSSHAGIVSSCSSVAPRCDTATGRLPGLHRPPTSESLPPRLVQGVSTTNRPYDNQVTLAYALGPVDIRPVDAALAGIYRGGSTNPSSGWLMGVEELRRIEDGIRRVVVLSAGHANDGITDPSVLARLGAEVEGSGSSTDTIGFGYGFDEHLMAAVADSGGGSRHLVRSPDDAVEIFSGLFNESAILVTHNLFFEISSDRR